jgi:aminoglycoside phosphotransferase (APT) family kinase protein
MTANASELLLLRERFHSPATLQARRTLPEVIAQEALVDALRDALSTPTLTMAAPPSSLQGGFSRVLIHVRVRSGTVEVPEDLVVRILPDVEARDREVAFQATLARQGFPTIEIIATGDGNDEIGPFSVMPFVAGRPFVDLESPREMVGAFRRVPAQLARTMATLHAVDPAEVMRAFDAHATRPDVDALLEQV